MSDEEVRAFLGEKMVMQCATNGPRGLPHMVALWFVLNPELRSWTYAKSQKARNLDRDPRATLGFEEGVQCDVVLERDPQKVEQFGLDLFARYAGELNDDIRAMVAKQAEKRVGLTFVPTRTVTWDHRKLGGVY